MNDEAREAFSLARRHMAESRRLDPAATPMLASHGAYYAMYHAARAVLLDAHGTASTNHGRLERAFAEFAKESGLEEARQCSALLRAAANRRTLADYTGEEINPDEAADGLAAAEAFLAFAARRLGLPTDTP